MENLEELKKKNEMYKLSIKNELDLFEKYFNEVIELKNLFFNDDIIIKKRFKRRKMLGNKYNRIRIELDNDRTMIIYLFRPLKLLYHGRPIYLKGNELTKYNLSNLLVYELNIKQILIDKIMKEIPGKIEAYFNQKIPKTDKCEICGNKLILNARYCSHCGFMFKLPKTLEDYTNIINDYHETKKRMELEYNELKEKDRYKLMWMSDPELRPPNKVNEVKEPKEDYTKTINDYRETGKRHWMEGSAFNSANEVREKRIHDIVKRMELESNELKEKEVKDITPLYKMSEVEFAFLQKVRECDQLKIEKQKLRYEISDLRLENDKLNDIRREFEKAKEKEELPIIGKLEDQKPFYEMTQEDGPRYFRCLECGRDVTFWKKTGPLEIPCDICGEIRWQEIKDKKPKTYKCQLCDHESEIIHYECPGCRMLGSMEEVDKC